MQSDNETIANKEHVRGHFLADMREISWEQTLINDQTLLRLARPPARLVEALSKRFSLDELYIKDMLNPGHPSQFTLLKNGAMHIILRFPVIHGREDEDSEVTSVSILADNKMCALIWPGERYHHFSNHDLI